MVEEIGGKVGHAKNSLRHFYACDQIYMTVKFVAEIAYYFLFVWYALIFGAST